MFQDLFCAGTWCEKRCADNQLFLAGTQGETLPLDTIVQQMLVNLRNPISEERMMRFLQNGGAHMSWDFGMSAHWSQNSRSRKHEGSQPQLEQQTVANRSETLGA